MCYTLACETAGDARQRAAGRRARGRPLGRRRSLRGEPAATARSEQPGIAAWAYTSTFGGGLVDGDEIACGCGSVPARPRRLHPGEHEGVPLAARAAQGLRAEVGDDGPGGARRSGGAVRRGTYDESCSMSSPRHARDRRRARCRACRGRRALGSPHRAAAAGARRDGALVLDDGLLLDPAHGDVARAWARSTLGAMLSSGRGSQVAAGLLAASAPAPSVAARPTIMPPPVGDGCLLRIAAASTAPWRRGCEALACVARAARRRSPRPDAGSLRLATCRHAPDAPRTSTSSCSTAPAFLAQKRLARGLRLNYPEAVALHRDAAPRAHPRRPLGRRADGRRAQDARPRQVHARRRRADRRGAGRGDVPRRHEARHRARPDRARGRRSRARALRQLPAGHAATLVRHGRPSARRRAGRDRRRAAGEIELNAGRAVDRARRHEPRRPADPGRQPLPVRRDEPRARVRPRARPRGKRLDIPAGHRGALRARRHARPCRLVATAGARHRACEDAPAHGRTASIARSTTPPCTARPPATASASATPASSSRSSATSPSTATSASSAAARCCATRMGQTAGVRDDRRARLRDHQRAHRRLDRHLQGRRRHQGRPHRRHRQGRQPATSWPA